MPGHFIGIDVGTGSARAGIFDATGTMLASAKTDIRMWREQGDVVEQSSEDIWRAVCKSVRAAIAEAGVAPQTVAGIGFDATCSLVVLGPGGTPAMAGPSRDPQRNIIVWMDHRATDQARRINATGQDVLRYVGGSISPEMETPKLLWLAEKMPEAFAAAWRFFDLTDFLTWRATGSEARSLCTVTCKWTYLAHENRWDEAYFRAVGLGALADEGFERIGTEFVPGGTPLGSGLTPLAASDLGLLPGTAVAAGLIDAHAGGIGTVGARGGPGTVLTRMAYVFGTSACTMTTTAQPAFVDGVWGPYFSAMVPGLWLNEGGQSAAGAAIDHLVSMHPAHAEAAGLRGGARPWCRGMAGGAGCIARRQSGGRRPGRRPACRAGIPRQPSALRRSRCARTDRWHRHGYKRRESRRSLSGWAVRPGLRRAANHPGTASSRHPDGHHRRQRRRRAEQSRAPDSRGFHGPCGRGIDLAGAGASGLCNLGRGRGRRISRHWRGDDGHVGTR